MRFCNKVYLAPDSAWLVGDPVPHFVGEVMGETKRRQQRQSTTGANDQSVSTVFKLGRFTCSLPFPIASTPGSVSGLQADWSPDVPKRGDLTRDDVAAYRRGRDTLISEVARLTGQRILVVE